MGSVIPNLRLRLHQPFTSLVTRLAVVYLGLALLAAGVVRAGVLQAELSALDRDLRGGWLSGSTAAAAARFPGRGSADALPAGAELKPWLTATLAGLRASEDGEDGEGRAGVLSELSDPVGLAVLDARGRLVASTGAAIASPRAPLTASPVARLAAPRPGAWRYAALLSGRGGRPLGTLLVELTPGPPGLRALIGDGVEWPAVLVYVLVFALGSALVLSLLVTRRLKRIAEAAAGWSAGDFSRTVDDGSSDEIGALAARLNAMAGELETLVALRAELASLSERQRLARDLHDTVKQKAFALQLQLATARRGAGADTDVARTLDEARAITSQIQHELAALIEAPPETVEAAFSQVLADRAQTWARWGGFAVTVEVAGAEAVPPEQRPMVLRILDEALANVMRHSGARNAALVVRRRGDDFEMTVSDDGRGLTGFRPGMGLANMRLRAAELPGGRLALDAGKPGARLSLAWSMSDKDVE
jgi:signal transduction histidine kinase